VNPTLKATRITWLNFLEFNALVKHYTASHKTFVRFWMMFLNPGGSHAIEKTAFVDILEKLVRGSLTEAPTIVSSKFS
jgi:hypothetical protein